MMKKMMMTTMVILMSMIIRILKTVMYLLWQMAALYNHHASYSARLAISSAAQPLLHHIYIQSCPTAVIKCPKHCSCPHVCSRLRVLGIHD